MVAPPRPLPTPWTAARLWEGLFERPVVMTACARWPMQASSRMVISLYQDAMRQLVYVAAVDVELAIFAGSALSRVPPGVAKDSAANGTLLPGLLDNFGEVMNVTCRAFVQPALALSPIRVASTHIHTGRDKKLLETAAMAVSGVSWHARIDGYGEGNLMVMDVATKEPLISA